MKMKKDGNLSSATEFLVFMHAGFIGIGLVSGIEYLIFEKLNVSNFLFAGFLIAASLLTICIVWLCKVLVDCIHRKLKVEDLTKYRNDFLIAFGISGILSVVLRILAYFPELSKTFAVTSVVYLITVPAIYYFFVYQTLDKKCTWIQMDGETTAKFICATIPINLILFIVCLRIANEYDDIKTTKKINGLQLFLTFPFAIIFAELARVLLFGLQLINVDGEGNEVIKKSVELKKVKNKNIPKPETASKPVAPKPTCNICSAAYTENGVHTPRIIKECGHSVCEQCAGELLKLKTENFLICPFCQKVTIVNGAAALLPKNFALLEQMAEMQQDPIRMV